MILFYCLSNLSILEIAINCPLVIPDGSDSKHSIEAYTCLKSIWHTLWLILSKKSKSIARLFLVFGKILQGQYFGYCKVFGLNS